MCFERQQLRHVYVPRHKTDGERNIAAQEKAAALVLEQLPLLG
jgi:hypothetical protein